jgi:hypothetical protein
MRKWKDKLAERRRFRDAKRRAYKRRRDVKGDDV